jgi:TPP-dependent pyruvate/acetoin dehydrogenase alpha subunit
MKNKSVLTLNEIKTKFKLSNISKTEDLISNYKKILTIRELEEKIAKEIYEGKIKTPCHLSIGQEAIAVGVCNQLVRGDTVYSTHRSHAHFISSGGSIQKLISEIYGSSNGASKGMGGSMHLFHNNKIKFFSTPIVGGTIPISLGSAFYNKNIKKSKNVSICFFGDGATEEGVFHESLNFAAKYELPVLFVCENNLYSSHLDIRLRQVSDNIRRYSDSHNINSCIVNGNNIEEVSKTANKKINYIRKNSKPCLIEAITYRLVGHVGPNKDIDVGVRRSNKEFKIWEERDPIKIIENYFIKKNVYSHNNILEIKQEILKKIKRYFQNVNHNFHKPSNKNLMKFHRSYFND